MTDTEKILDKLKKLKAHAESAEKIGNTEEAEAFASMLNRLLLKHKLELTDVEFAAQEKEDPVTRRWIDYDEYPDLVKNVRIEWMTRLADVIARAHFCDIIVGHKTSRISLVGRGTDIEVAEYMIVTLQRAADRLADKETARYRWEVYKRDRSCAAARGFRKAFLQAFVERITQRYLEERRSYTQSTALVRINASEQAVKDHMRKLRDAGTTRLVVSHSTRADHAEGSRRGRELADSINLKANVVRGGSSRGELS